MFLFRRTSSAQTLRLQGERLYLRVAEDRDYRAYCEVRTQSRAFLEPWEPAWLDDALTRDTFARRVRRADQDWRDDQAYGFVLVRRADQRLMGGIALNNVRRGVAQAGTLGYWIGQEYSRQRYMSEALRLLLGYSFGPLGLHRIEAACLPHNEASRRLLIGAGFEEEGRARHYLKINGIWHDHLLYGLLATEFRPER